jgi:superfamily II DNA or RNA helicase
MNYEELIKLKGLEEIPYQKEFLTNPMYQNNPKPVVLSMGTSGGKTLTTILMLELFYSNPKNKGKKTLLIPSDKVILRDNFSIELQKFNPSFSWCVSTNKTELEKCLSDKNLDVLVVLPQTIIGNYHLLKRLHNFILDESHQWYFKPTIQTILSVTKPKQQFLLTGTPSKFNSKKDKFDFMYVPIMEMYRLGKVSNVKIEVVSSEYDLSFKDFTNLGEVDESKLTKVETLKSFDNMFDNMLQMIGGIDNLEKTIIFCRSISQSDIIFGRLSKIKELKGKVLISHSEGDRDSKHFETFRSDIETKILVVVGRGRLGYNFPNLCNVIDFTMGVNIDTLLQMYGRLLRIPTNGVELNKTYYKVVPKNLQYYYSSVVECMLRLTDIPFYSTYEGKINELPVLNRNPKVSGNRSSGFTITPKSLPFSYDLDYLTKIDTKYGSDFTSVGYTTLDNIKGLYTKGDTQKEMNDIRKICDSYDTFSIFKKENPSLPQFLRRKGLLEDYTSHMSKCRNHSGYSETEIIMVCKKYTIYKDFCNNETSLSVYLKRNGLLEKYCTHMERIRKVKYVVNQWGKHKVKSW